MKEGFNLLTYLLCLLRVLVFFTCVVDGGRHCILFISFTQIQKKIQKKEEEIFFTTSNNGVFKVSKKNKEPTNYQFDPLDPFSLSSSKFSENQTNPLVKKDGVLWVGTTNGLNQINIKTGQTKRYYSGKTSFVKADTVTTLLLVGDILHIGTTRGLTKLNLTTNQQVETFIHFVMVE